MLIGHLVLVASFVLTPAAVRPITESNWKQHPRIREIRNLYLEIQKLATDGKLKAATHEMGDCENYQDDMSREIFRDAKGKVRKLVLGAGSGDSSIDVNAYYDASGKLRFVFVIAGAVNDTSMEIRVYFDGQGKRLWEDRKIVAGPGYPFPNPWPDEYAPHDAEARFTRPSKCD